MRFNESSFSHHSDFLCVLVYLFIYSTLYILPKFTLLFLQEKAGRSSLVKLWGIDIVASTLCGSTGREIAALK